MAEDLQALLDRIRKDGLERTQEENAALLATARREADALLATARTEAAQIIAAARRETALLEEKGRDALRQAARDTLLSLRAELEKRLLAVTTTTLATALARPEDLAPLLLEVLRACAAAGETSLEIQVPPERLASLDQALLAGLAADLRSGVTLAPRPEINAGFRVICQNQGISYEFTDAALAETLASRLSPKLAELLKPASPGLA